MEGEADSWKVSMKVKRLGWLGTRTQRFEDMRRFLQEVMGLALVNEEPDFAMFRLPGGTRDFVEVIGPSDTDYTFYTTGPVVGFVVEDLEGARAEMEAAGVELIGPLTWAKTLEGYGWFHFRGPDGNVYGVLQGTEAVAERPGAQGGR